MSCGVYKITNPNNRLYIGQSKNIESRWNTYYKLQCKTQPILFKSLKKYGIENHTFEIIEECPANLLIERETFWKLHFKVLEIESLCCRIDGPNGMLSEQTRKNLSESSKGKTFKHTKPKKLILHNSDGIERITKSQPNRREVLQFDLEMNFIQEWSSINSVNKTFKISIHNCLLGKLKTCNGFIWKYKDDKVVEFKRPVDQFDLELNFIRRFESISEASKELNLSIGSIIFVCKNKLYSTGGFIWKYSDDKSFTKTKPPKKRKVYQFDNDKNLVNIFDTINDAKLYIQTAYNIDPLDLIDKCCSKKINSANGFLWSYNPFPNEYKPNRSIKSIYQLDIKTNQIICEFNSIADAVKKYECSGIYNCLRGKSSSAVGYNWIYKETI